MKAAHQILNTNHWTLEQYKQRMSVADWKKVLSETADHIIFHGRTRYLSAKTVGFGFVDVSKKPIEENL